MKKLSLYVFLVLMFSNKIFAFENFKALPDLDLYLGVDIRTLSNSMAQYKKNICTTSYIKTNMPLVGHFDFGYDDQFINFAEKFSKDITVHCNDNSYKFININNEPQEKDFFFSFTLCRGIVVEYSLTSHLRYEDFGKNPAALERWIHFFEQFSKKKPEIKKYEEDFKSSTGEISKMVYNERMWDDKKNDILFYIYSNIYHSKKYGPGTGANQINISLVNNSSSRIKACF